MAAPTAAQRAAGVISVATAFDSRAVKAFDGVTIVDDATRVPLYTHTPGFVSLSLGAGVTITRRVSVNLSLTNLLDRSYRIHGSGVDAPGRGGFVSVNVSY